MPTVTGIKIGIRMIGFGIHTGNVKSEVGTLTFAKGFSFVEDHLHFTTVEPNTLLPSPVTVTNEG